MSIIQKNRKMKNTREIKKGKHSGAMDNAGQEYEEIEFICESCGKKVKRVRRKSKESAKFLCQRCGKELAETE